MYSVVLLAAVTMGGESLDCHRRGGCRGGYGGCAGVSYGGCYGGNGGCYGGNGGCYGGNGGCYGGCSGVVYGGCSGVVYGGCSGVVYGGCAGIVYGGCGCGIVAAPSTPETPAAPERDKQIDEVIAFLKEQGAEEDETGKALLDELEKAQETADSQKEWVDYYTGPITPEEEKSAADVVKSLKTPEEKKVANDAWKAAKTPAEKRYILKWYGIEVSKPAPARLVVTLPEGARLTVDGEQTVSTAARRVFVSPELPPGKTYRYTLRATYTQDGAPVVVTRKVRVSAGSKIDVTLLPNPAVAAR